MFRSRSIKHALLLLRHAEKVLRYRRDVMSETARVDFERHIEDLHKAVRARDERAIKEKGEALDALVGRQAAPHWELGWRENVEVVLVAIVVAVAVRSYFIQPFKIPTGSMQPTLNGIIGHPSAEKSPNFLVQIAEFVIRGRNYIDVVARDDVRVDQITSQKYLYFFTWSRVICDRGNYLIYAPPETLQQDFQVREGRHYQRGDVIAQGWIDTGDQVFVDKFSYNFIKPRRGDVFVFRTNHIGPIVMRTEPGQDPPYYIKRLVGLSGDTLRVDPPLLYVKGASDAAEHLQERFGIRRVMGAKPPYRGYSLSPGQEYMTNPTQKFTVPAHAFFAMGDNSYNSWDSRFWGPVPEENLVGRGLLVYWPFAPHWGIIR
ncbi:MAG: signal peptidase I [Verrucomicrobiota bacterium]|nr:signal peptidase I [Verrucomicrobiota bacterium]